MTAIDIAAESRTPRHLREFLAGQFGSDPA